MVERTGLMQVLSVLTPPLLVCAAIIVAVVAFLRHEMSRARSGQSAPGDELSAPSDEADGKDGEPHRGSEPTQAPGRSSRPRR